MADLKIFISSTYFDLKYIRKDLEMFILEMGYKPCLFESGNILFHHDKHLDESCYKAIDDCQMFILVLGGRYGSPASDSDAKEREAFKNNDKMYIQYNSITKNEYLRAKANEIPIFIFVEKEVYDEYKTYQQNRKNETTRYAYVDNVNIYKLLDEIYADEVGKYVKDFQNIQDITSWLKLQWAGLLAEYLINKNKEIEIQDLAFQVSELKSVSNTLKEYIEEIMKGMNLQGSQQIIEKNDKRMEIEKAAMFYQEPMIRHLVNSYNLESEPLKIFKAFEESINLQNFLELIELSTDNISIFMVKDSGLALRDYEKLRKKYLDDKPDISQT